METKNIGLRGIEVADTRISNIDGQKGKLIYRGFDILDLTKNSTFEETAYLLLYDNLPTKAQLDEFNSKLVDARYIPKQMQKNMGNWRKDADPMDMLQAFVAALAGYYDEEFSNKNASYDRAINLIAKVPTIIASWQRIRNGLPIVDPDSSLSHAANFLYMMSGEKPDPEVEKVFDTCLILHADHTFNASTFTARQVASTRAHMYSAVSAAIGALSGELHGGANTEVMKMLLEIQEIQNVEPWIKEKMSAGERIMGMGHAVYKTYDPRAQVLKELSRKLAEKTKEPWFDMTEKVETTTISEMKAQKGKDIYPNVDLYSASIYYMLKIPVDLNTPIFAISRVVGWAAHIIEEKFAEAAPKPALYRPKATYVGKYCGPEGCEYKTLDLRK
ncbi:citrate (Si)-synthase [Candidatus Nitrosopumilus sp. SW]|uniref:citrate synthase n=1 Tax=Candidatus Nitrosopumilus sp. SW TaxID=2508726 RepID=UPI0011510A37|nr:citrate synthase [Candidatus Nitrosopumilus sp. SW]QDI89464.1 citrate (Si)-synthase [Candidatus Nitrosopumilus sp. SW]